MLEQKYFNMSYILPPQLKKVCKSSRLAHFLF